MKNIKPLGKSQTLEDCIGAKGLLLSAVCGVVDGTSTHISNTVILVHSNSLLSSKSVGVGDRSLCTRARLSCGKATSPRKNST